MVYVGTRTQYIEALALGSTVTFLGARSVLLNLPDSTGTNREHTQIMHLDSHVNNKAAIRRTIQSLT